jgi:hypothetical protein
MRLQPARTRLQSRSDQANTSIPQLEKIGADRQRSICPTKSTKSAQSGSRLDFRIKAVSGPLV